VNHVLTRLSQLTLTLMLLALAIAPLALAGSKWP
jgi:hypothetical protein